MIYLFLFFLLSPWILFFFYTVTIQYARGGLFKIFAVFGVIAIPLDIFYNYTAFIVLMMDIPQRKEYTFSSRLERLILRNDWRGKFATEIAICLNAICPTHNHIKNAIGKTL